MVKLFASLKTAKKCDVISFFNVKLGAYTRARTQRGSARISVGFVGNLASLDRHPLESLPPPSDAAEDHQRRDPFDSGLLPFVRLGLRSPLEEGRDILGHLCDRRGSAVLVFHLPIHAKRRFHGDGTAGKVGVVVEALSKLHTGRGVPIPGKKRKDVVFAARSRLDNQRKVGRIRTTIRGASGLFVRVGRRKPIEELPGAFEHLAGVVGSIRDLNRLGEHFGVLPGVRDADQVAVAHKVHCVARAAHLAVHLVPAAHARGIERVEHTVVRPRHLRRGDVVVTRGGLVPEEPNAEHGRANGERQRALLHHIDEHLARLVQHPGHLMDDKGQTASENAIGAAWGASAREITLKI